MRLKCLIPLLTADEIKNQKCTSLREMSSNWVPCALKAVLPTCTFLLLTSHSFMKQLIRTYYVIMYVLVAEDVLKRHRTHSPWPQKFRQDKSWKQIIIMPPDMSQKRDMNITWCWWDSFRLPGEETCSGDVGECGVWQGYTRKWERAGSSFSSCLAELGMSLRT